MILGERWESHRMAAEAEKTTEIENAEISNGDLNAANNEIEASSEEELSHDKSEFALKLVNAVKSMNSGELSYHEMINSFVLADELKCLFLFIKRYPTIPFLEYIRRRRS